MYCVREISAEIFSLIRLFPLHYRYLSRRIVQLHMYRAFRMCLFLIFIFRRNEGDIWIVSFKCVRSCHDKDYPKIPI